MEELIQSLQVEIRMAISPEWEYYIDQAGTLE
jgi:hypothetical protein